MYSFFTLFCVCTMPTATYPTNYETLRDMREAERNCGRGRSYETPFNCYTSKDVEVKSL